MEFSTHYLLMADHAMLQKLVMSRIKPLGLTTGQPKVLDFLQDHDGAMCKNSCYLQIDCKAIKRAYSNFKLYALRLSKNFVFPTICVLTSQNTDVRKFPFGNFLPLKV